MDNRILNSILFHSSQHYAYTHFIWTTERICSNNKDEEVWTFLVCRAQISQRKKRSMMPWVHVCYVETLVLYICIYIWPPSLRKERPKNKSGKESGLGLYALKKLKWLLFKARLLIKPVNHAFACSQFLLDVARAPCKMKVSYSGRENESEMWFIQRLGHRITYSWMHNRTRNGTVGSSSTP